MNESSLYNGLGRTAQSNNLKKLSVIIPAYNAAKFLAKCVDSVVNQTYKNIEIILIDDGSGDNTPQICDELANKYKNIKVIHQDNQGSSKVRETGLNAASGEYIAFIDSDDYIDLNAYEKAIKVLEENNCDMVMFGVYMVDPNGKILDEWRWPAVNLNNSREVFKFFAKTEKPVWGMTYKVYRCRMFENIDWPKLTMSEDYYISAQLFARAQKFAAISEIFYYYVQQEASICHQPYNKSKREGIITAHNFVIDLTQNKFPDLLPEIISRRLESIVIILTNCLLSDCSDKLEAMRQCTKIYKHDYKIMKAELKRQGRKSELKSLVRLKQKVYLWLLIHCPRLYKFYLTTRLKIHTLTGI
ncbi:MAG: glycosyltransferase family 2 protein [Synergistaceae bacterium]|nr:glycosyltransferase family 2 protein [Synergistaceae bacterium]